MKETTMIQEISIKDLIQEGRERANRIQYHPDAFLPYYDFSDKDAYYAWLGKASRLLNIQYPGDKDVEKFEKLSEASIGPAQQSKLLAILEAFEALPQLVKREDDSQPSTVIVNNQTQQQSQNMCSFVFSEAIKDEITGKQLKELMEIVNDKMLNDVEKQRTLIEKLKSFGIDVLGSIIANIITNPLVSAIQ